MEDPSREVKKVRKARNRRQEWNVMAYDKEFRPDARFTPSPYHGMSSEGSLSPDNRLVVSFALTLFSGNKSGLQFSIAHYCHLLRLKLPTLGESHQSNLKRHIIIPFYLFIC